MAVYNSKSVSDTTSGGGGPPSGQGITTRMANPPPFVLNPGNSNTNIYIDYTHRIILNPLKYKKEDLGNLWWGIKIHGFIEQETTRKSKEVRMYRNWVKHSDDTGQQHKLKKLIYKYGRLIVENIKYHAQDLIGS